MQNINTSCVTTATATSETHNSAILGGNVTDDNFHILIRRGICLSNSDTDPELDDDVVTIGNGLGTFSQTVSGLSLSTTYYCRAF